MSARRDRPKKRVVLTGFDLSLDDVVAVAREGARVALDRGAIVRMRAARRIVESAIARGDAIYGATTGVGANKRRAVPAREVGPFNRLLVSNHRVGQGPDAPADVVRAALLR